MKPTQEYAILTYLSHTDGWVPSYYLNKIELEGVWVGDRGSRTARDLATEDKILRYEGKELISKGISKDHLGKLIVPKYTYYHAKTVLQKVELFITLPTGERKLVGVKYE